MKTTSGGQTHWVVVCRRQLVPDGVMLHKDARAAFNKSTSIFILMLTTMCVPAR